MRGGKKRMWWAQHFKVCWLRETCEMEPWIENMEREKAKKQKQFWGEAKKFAGIFMTSWKNFISALSRRESESRNSGRQLWFEGLLPSITTNIALHFRVKRRQWRFLMDFVEFHFSSSTKRGFGQPTKTLAAKIVRTWVEAAFIMILISFLPLKSILQLFHLHAINIIAACWRRRRLPNCSLLFATQLETCTRSIAQFTVHLIRSSTTSSALIAASTPMIDFRVKLFKH